MSLKALNKVLSPPTPLRFPTIEHCLESDPTDIQASASPLHALLLKVTWGKVTLPTTLLYAQ